MAKSRAGAWPLWILGAPLIVIGVASVRWIGKLMPSCLFHQQTGWHCPGCGATRAAMGMAEGRWLEALGNNSLFVAGMVIGTVWIVLSGLRQKFPEARSLRIFRFQLWNLWVILGMILAFGLLRNLPSMEWLAPR